MRGSTAYTSVGSGPYPTGASAREWAMKRNGFTGCIVGVRTKQLIRHGKAVPPHSLVETASLAGITTSASELNYIFDMSIRTSLMSCGTSVVNLSVPTRIPRPSAKTACTTFRNPIPGTGIH